MEIPQEKLSEFRKKLSEYYLYEIFASQFEVSDRLRQLKTLQNDPERIKQLESMNERMRDAKDAQNAAKKLVLKAKKYGDKVSATKAFDDAEGVLEKIKSEKSRFMKPLTTLYQEISHFAEQVEQKRKAYHLTLSFDGTVKEKLSHAEIDGTKYVMENNILKKNEFGQMVLLIEPKKDGETNLSPTPTEA